MENQMQKTEDKKEMGQKDIDLLIKVNMLPKNISQEMVAFFIQFCNQTGLNPMKRQVFIIPRGDKFSIQVGIDGYRALADKSQLYAGSDDPIIENEDNPQKATVTVWKMVNGQRCPFTASARMKEYKPNSNSLWDRMPAVMLGKCAESLALRKAFPNELSGIYTDEEMQQADTQSGQTFGDKKAASTPMDAADLFCSKCEKPITQRVGEYSANKFGRLLCITCQKVESTPAPQGKKEADEEYNVEEVI